MEVLSRLVHEDAFYSFLQLLLKVLPRSRLHVFVFGSAGVLLERMPLAFVLFVRRFWPFRGNSTSCLQGFETP